MSATERVPEDPGTYPYFCRASVVQNGHKHWPRSAAPYQSFWPLVRGGPLSSQGEVEASSSNYTGTMIRVSVTRAMDRAKVAVAVRKALAENKPIALAGDELRRALEKEQWRGTARIGELSAIEFRAMALYRIKTFARAEKLDKETADKLTRMAEDQWEHLAEEPCFGDDRPEAANGTVGVSQFDLNSEDGRSAFSRNTPVVALSLASTFPLSLSPVCCLTNTHPLPATAWRAVTDVVAML